MLYAYQDRQDRIKKNRRYAANNPDLPEMGDKLAESWKRFQAEARTNWAELIVESLVERVVPNAIIIDNDETAETAARRIWRDNRMDSLFTDLATDIFTCSVGYLLITKGDDGKALITVENPENVVTIQDPIRPWRSVAALKIWRDPQTQTDHAYVWHDNLRVHWYRDRKESGNKWASLDIPDLYKTPASTWIFDKDGVSHQPVPLRRFDNRKQSGEFEEAIPVIDRINRELLNRLVIAAMQAFRQRALQTEDGEGLEEYDENGNKIDYDAVFEPAPGALWELPPGVRIWESANTDISQLLAAEKEDIRQLAASTKTPLPSLMPESANQSAEGARYANEGAVNKAKDRIKRIRPNLEAAIIDALRIENIPVTGTLKIEFEPPQMISMAEKYDAATKAKAIGESVESIQRNILGYSQAQIDKDRLARAHEALAASLAIPAAPEPAAEQ